MPTTVIAALASYVVSSAASAFVAGWIAQTIGAIVGAAITSALSKSGGGGDSARPSVGSQTITVRSPAAPRVIIYGRARTGGTLTHMETTKVPISNGVGTTSYLHMVITLAGHVCEEIEAVYFDDQEVPIESNGEVTTGQYSGAVYVVKSLGDETTQPFPVLVAASAGGWTNAHQQAGCTKLYVRLTFNVDQFPNGVPNVTAIVKGKKVYDPRTATTAWSDNPALIVADYLMDDTFGLGHALAELDSTALTAAANVCDESVTLASGSTESRYTCDGTIDSSISPKNAIATLLGSMHGTAVYIGGTWRINAGAYLTPTVTWDEDDFAGPVRVQSLLSRRDNFNAVKGIFTDPSSLWQPTDFPPITNSTYEEEDNDERVWQDIELPYTTSASMAQRLAKIHLERARQPITVAGRLKLSAYAVQPPDTVMLTLTRFGWSSKVFEVTEATLAVETDGALAVDVVLRETASAVYTWSSSEEQTIDPAPATNLPNPLEVDAPGAIAVTETLYTTRDNTGVKSKAVVTWQVSPDPYVVTYQPEYKLHTDTDYTVLPITGGASVELADIAPGDYDIRVKAMNVLGVSSDYTTARTQVYGLLSPPSAISGLTIQTAGGLAILQWTQPTDQDVLIGGRVDIRHSDSESGGPLWAEATPIGQPLPGAQTIAVVPLKSGTYFVRPYDSSGMAATSATSVSTNGATALDYANVDSMTEDAAFSGSKTDTVVSASKLKLDAIGNVDAQADFDLIVFMDSIGGIKTSGSYAFAATMDLTTVQRVRVTSRLTGEVVSVADQVDMRGVDVDDWPDFDGDVDGDEAAAWVEYRRTPDDPAGTPTWSSWERLEQSEAYARAFQFRAQLRSYDPDFNIELSALGVDADAVA